MKNIVITALNIVKIKIFGLMLDRNVLKLLIEL